MVNHIEHISRVRQLIDIITDRDTTTTGRDIVITDTHDKKVDSESLFAAVLGTILFISWAVTITSCIMVQ